MSFQDTVLRLYDPILRRLRSWGFLAVFFVIYVSAFFMHRVSSAQYISSIALHRLHVISGLCFLLILLILLYDRINRSTISDQPVTRGTSKPSTPPRLIINRVFYGLGTVTALIGALMLMSQIAEYRQFQTYLTPLTIVHHILGWLFFSILLVKAYVGMIKSIQNILTYLREV